MKIFITLDIMLVKRKMSLTELSKGTDITISNLSLLKTGKTKRIRFSTLNKICNVLACKPGDIIELVSDEEYKKLFRIPD
jgi:putative transcriptional regulator